MILRALLDLAKLVFSKWGGSTNGANFFRLFFFFFSFFSLFCFCFALAKGVVVCCTRADEKHRLVESRLFRALRDLQLPIFLP